MATFNVYTLFGLWICKQTDRSQNDSMTCGKTKLIPKSISPQNNGIYIYSQLKTN